MIEITASCRKNFNWTTDFSGSLQFRRGNVPMTKEEVSSLTAGARVCVLVHGYRSEEAAVQKTVSAIALNLTRYELDKQYDVLISFIWPGGWAFISFPFASMRAHSTSQRLTELLKLLQVASAVDVQTHSLGARVALDLDSRALKVRNLFLLAGAVPRRLPDIGADNIHVLYSRQDPVLRWVYPIAATATFNAPVALGYAGPEGETAGNVHSFDCSEFVFNHSGYRDRPETYEYWRAALSL